MRSRLLPVGAALAALVLIAGCGGGGKTTTSSTTTSGTTTTGKQKTKSKPKLEQSVRVDSKDSKFASSVGATNGDIIEFRTLVPPSKHAGTVTLKLTQANGKIQATASANHQTSTATVVGSGLKMSRIHYSCRLPPTPSFCPASHISSGKGGYQLQFPATRKAPVELAALVATSPPAARKLRPTSTAAVAPYTLTQKVKVVTPASSSSSNAKPTSTAVVHPGDVVTLSTYVGGKVSGALQPVTITINQGPAKSITVSAASPGGQATHATISGANGANITLTDARYNCFLAPDPTFCPVSKVTVGHRKYEVTFRASPNKSPVQVVANVQAG